MAPKNRHFRLILDVYKVKDDVVVQTAFKGGKSLVSILEAIGALRIAELDLLDSKLIADKVMEKEAQK